MRRTTRITWPIAPARFAAVGFGLCCAMIAAFDPVPPAPAEDLSRELRKTCYKIVYETYRDGNWEWPCRTIHTFTT